MLCTNLSDLVTISLSTYDDMISTFLLEETELVPVEVTTLLDRYLHIAVLFAAALF